MKSVSNSSNAMPLLTAALCAAGIMTSANAQIQTAGTLFVDVDATILPYGAALSVPG